MFLNLRKCCGRSRFIIGYLQSDQPRAAVSFIVKAIFQLYRDSVVGSCAALAAIRKSHRNVVRSFRRRFLQRGGHAAVLLQVLASAVVELHLQFSQSIVFRKFTKCKWHNFKNGNNALLSKKCLPFPCSKKQTQICMVSDFGNNFNISTLT